MKKLILALTFGAVMPAAYASGTLELWGNAFRLDTLEHFYIGPGVTHSHILLSKDGRNLDVVVATLDKTDPSYNNLIRPRVEIGQDEAREVERISNVAVRKSNDERQFIAGVNADFFYMTDEDIPARGYSVNPSVIDGKFASPAMRGDHLYGLIIGPEGMWIDDVNNFSYTLSSSDGSQSANVNSINRPERGGSELHAYNSYMQGSVTTSASWDRDLTLVLAEGSKWAINAPMTFKVSEDWRDGAGAIPADGMVLTATKGYANEWIESLKPGDEVTFEISYALKSYGNIKPEITHFVSGDVHFLDNGATNFNPPSKWYNLYVQSENYPMSMAGFSKDQQKFVLATISRSGPNNSTGINYPEAADLMRYLGCNEAVNFDGGGSATMYAAPMGVVSHLLYDKERPVANGLYLTMDAPADKTVTSLRFSAPYINLALYDTYRPTIYGYNQYGQLVDMDVRDFNIDANDNFEISEASIMASKAGSHTLSISKDGMQATLPVYVNAQVPAPLYPKLVLDPQHTAYPTLYTVLDNHPHYVTDAAYTWTSSDPAVLDIDAESGRMTALSRGEATVTGQRDGNTVEIAVSVEIASDKLLPLDENFGSAEWIMTPDGVENITVSAIDNGWALEFDSTRKRGLKLTLSKEIIAYGLPSKFGIDINTNGSRISTLTLSFDAANGLGSFELSPESTVTDGGSLIYDFAKAFDTGNYAYYPLTFRAFNFAPLSNADGSTHIKYDISNMGFIYDNPTTSVADIVAGTAITKLPLSIDGRIISTTAPVSALEVYSIDGRLVATAAGQTIEAPSTPGLYIVAGRTASGVLVAKLHI